MDGREGKGMIVSDFTPMGSQDDTQFAEITVTEHTVSNTKTTRHTIAKSHLHWFFVETGKFTPGSIVDDLERKYYAQLKLQKLTNQNHQENLE
jgi:hypothetical protein